MTWPALAEVCARLRALQPDYEHLYALDLAAAGLAWLPLEQVVEPSYRVALRDTPRSPAVAATRAASTLAHTVLGRVTAAIVTSAAAWDVGPGNLRVVLDETGYAERVTVRRPTIAVRSDSGIATAAGVAGVTSTAQLLDWVALRAVGTLQPLFTELRAVSRFGITPMWNLAADAVLSTATQLPLLVGAGVDGQRVGRAVGEQLVAALSRSGARLRSRAALQQLAWREGQALVPVRGTCCLWYRTQPDSRPDGEGYCLTCPYVPDRIRAERWPAQLDALTSAAEAPRRG